MKNLFLFSILLFCIKEDYNVKVLNKILISDRIMLEFKNSSKIPIFLYTGNISSNFNIVNSKNEILNGRRYSTWDPDITYPEISDELIRETAERYQIENRFAKKWLENKHKYFLIQPNEKKIISIEFEHRTSDNAYELAENKDYFFKGETNFFTNFVPAKYKDSLKKNNINFLDNIKTEYIIKIDINKFFRKECYEGKCFYIN